MNAYSNDLRKRVIAALQKGIMTKAEIMEQFDVSATFIYLLEKRFQETGSVEPKPHGGGMPAKFVGNDLERIRLFVEKNSDATLQEILDYSGKEASIMAVSRALDRLEFIRKKNRYGHRNKIEKM